MPFTVITLKNAPQSLRGDLTKWMQEISTGVYVGNFNTKIREKLWQRVVDSVGIGEATMSFTQQNEIGYNFKTHNSDKIPINFDGIPLVLVPSKNVNKKTNKYGFSKAAKIRKAKKYSKRNKENNKIDKKKYVILDIETSGLNPRSDSIIEIGAVKINGDKIDNYSSLIKYHGNLPETIKKLTNIKEDDLKKGKELDLAISELLEFISDYTIIGYNINFDIKFINEALKRNKKAKIKNKIYDVMKYVKKDKMFLKNYKLETVLIEYGIDEKVPHRALEDSLIIFKLSNKLNELMKKLN